MSVIIVVVAIALLILGGQAFLRSLLRHWYRFVYGFKQQPLSEDIILLTGASGGVGSTISIDLLQHRWRGLILTDIDLNSLNDLHQAIQQAGHTTIFCVDQAVALNANQQAVVQRITQSITDSELSIRSNPTAACNPPILFLLADISHSDIWHTIHHHCQQVYGNGGKDDSSPQDKPASVTIVINNAGVAHSVPHLSSQPSQSPRQHQNQQEQHEQHEQMSTAIYNINLHAPLRLIRSCFQHHMTSSHYSQTAPPQIQFLTVASAAAMSYATALGPYCGSKAALLHNLRTLRFEHQRLLFDPTYEMLSSSSSSSLPSSSSSSSSSSANSSPPSNLICQQGRSKPTFSPISIFALFRAIWSQIYPLSHPKTVSSTTPHVHWHTILPWHIDTFMFNEISALPLLQTLVPSLSQKYVADVIVSSLVNAAEDTSLFGAHTTFSELVLPRILSFTPLLSLLPGWLSDFAVGLAGGWNGMDTCDDPRQKHMD